MATPEQALATQLKNIETRCGKSPAALYALLAGCGLERVSEQRSWLMAQTGLGYGDANTIVLLAKKQPAAAVAAGAAGAPAAASVAAATSAGDPLDAIYAGSKAPLRPLHDALMRALSAFGEFEVAPKKGYVSLRRNKQFAMVGPATVKAIEVGLNGKSLAAGPRLKVLPPGQMCRATTRIESAAEIDATLLGWLRASYDEAG